VSLFSDADDVRVMTRLINRGALSFLGAAVGLISVMLLGIKGGPEFTGETSLYEFFGYFGLFCGTVLIMRVLVAILRDGLTDPRRHDRGDRERARWRRRPLTGGAVARSRSSSTAMRSAGACASRVAASRSISTSGFAFAPPSTRSGSGRIRRPPTMLSTPTATASTPGHQSVARGFPRV
jgi:hypothetical protein